MEKEGKENALIRRGRYPIILLENVQNYQDIKIKKRLLEDLGVIATKMKRKRQMTKSVLWLKLPMSLAGKSEVCADDELQTKKIIKFRLGGHAHSLTLLEFSRRLGLYQAVELEEEGFNVYFEGAWVIARWMKRKGADTQKESQIYCGQLILKIARKCMVLTEDVVRSLSAPIYYRDLDTTTLRDLIDSDSKLIFEDPQPGLPRVCIPRPPRASMQDLYDRMGRMEICQKAIKRMEYSQSYHWDMYQGVFEHMVRIYSVPLQGAYNPPGYAQPQYDQYYQQYPPPPSQYQQQQQDDDE
ncbi:hypothetical protein Tco_0065395 [Tanacetum coccineum]